MNSCSFNFSSQPLFEEVGSRPSLDRLHEESLFLRKKIAGISQKIDEADKAHSGFFSVPNYLFLNKDNLLALFDTLFGLQLNPFSLVFIEILIETVKLLSPVSHSVLLKTNIEQLSVLEKCVEKIENDFQNDLQNVIIEENSGISKSDFKEEIESLKEVIQKKKKELSRQLKKKKLRSLVKSFFLFSERITPSFSEISLANFKKVIKPAYSMLNESFTRQEIDSAISDIQDQKTETNPLSNCNAYTIQVEKFKKDVETFVSFIDTDYLETMSDDAKENWLLSNIAPQTLNRKDQYAYICRLLSEFEEKTTSSLTLYDLYNLDSIENEDKKNKIKRFLAEKVVDRNHTYGHALFGLSYANKEKSKQDKQLLTYKKIESGMESLFSLVCLGFNLGTLLASGGSTFLAGSIISSIVTNGKKNLLKNSSFSLILFFQPSLKLKPTGLFFAALEVIVGRTIKPHTYSCKGLLLSYRIVFLKKGLLLNELDGTVKTTLLKITLFTSRKLHLSSLTQKSEKMLEKLEKQQKIKQEEIGFEIAALIEEFDHLKIKDLSKEFSCLEIMDELLFQEVEKSESIEERLDYESKDDVQSLASSYQTHFAYQTNTALMEKQQKESFQHNGFNLSNILGAHGTRFFSQQTIDFFKDLGITEEESVTEESQEKIRAFFLA